MNKNKNITSSKVKVIENLSRLIVDVKEKEYFTKQFNETISVVDKLGEIKTENIKPTHQVTGLINVFREDKIDKNRILTQEEALSGSKNTHKGYFVVKAVFE